MIQPLKTPMEEARQAEALLNAAADRTRQPLPSLIRHS